MIIDGHCDTLTVALDQNKLINDKELNFNLESAKNLKDSVIQMMAIYISPDKYITRKINKSWLRTNSVIKNFNRQKEILKNEIIHITNVEDIKKVKQENKIGILLTIENGSAICGNLYRIKQLYDYGIRVMSITWNKDNELGCGAHTVNDKGLTNLGIKYVQQLNKNNIIIDVSHTSKKTFEDVIKYSNKPIIATHSCAYSICQHPRNLSDLQIKQIAQSGGIIGVCYYSDFLNNNGIANSDDIVKHIVYIVNLVGIDYVGLGSDFDGMDKNKLPTDIKNIEDIKLIKQKLIKRRFNSVQINKILGENWERFLLNNL